MYVLRQGGGGMCALEEGSNKEFKMEAQLRLKVDLQTLAPQSNITKKYY